VYHPVTIPILHILNIGQKKMKMRLLFIENTFYTGVEYFFSIGGIMEAFLGYLLLIPFIVFSAIHLWACVRSKTSVADMSKLFLMPSLLLFYIVFTLLQGGTIYWPVAAALVLSTIGDYFMRDEWDAVSVICGIIAFTLAQAAYLVFSIPQLDWEGLSLPVQLIVPFVYVLAVLFSMLRLKEYVSGIVVVILLYALAICGMSCVFTLMAIGGMTVPFWLMAVGGVIFLLSDTILSERIFVGRESAWGNFWVMVTYLLAQALIVVGIVR
jgi:uncharacterized membrane protein YhhN